MILLVRRLAVVSVVVLALLTCGVVVALAAPGGKSRPITKTSAEAFARAVNLRASDLPGYKSFAHPKQSRDAIGCDGQAHFHPIGAEGSALESRHEVVASAVAVMPSQAVAEAAVTALTSGRGRSCIARESKQTLGAEASTARVTFVPVPKMLGAGAIAVHAVAGKEQKGLHEDEVLFRVGPALIILFTLGERLLPAATEGRLLALLNSRAEAHKL